MCRQSAVMVRRPAGPLALALARGPRYARTHGHGSGSGWPGGSGVGIELRNIATGVPPAVQQVQAGAGRRRVDVITSCTAVALASMHGFRLEFYPGTAVRRTPYDSYHAHGIRVAITTIQIRTSGRAGRPAAAAAAAHIISRREVSRNLDETWQVTCRNNHPVSISI